MNERLASRVRPLWLTFWAGNIALLIWVWADIRWETFLLGGGAALVALGALCGLLGAYLILTQLLLISGFPPLEKAFGLDKLARWHHQNARYAYLLVMTHVGLIVGGYSVLSGNNFIAQFFELRSSLPYVALASLALIALNIVFLSSIYIVRKKLRYEWWRVVHFLVYAVVLLAFLHQINNGGEFLQRDWLRYYWWFLYFGALAIVLIMRYGQPALLSIRHNFKVNKVVPEAKDVTSVYIKGRNLKNFRYQAGQFNFWIFWQKGFRFQRHPFTISSSPGDPYLRISAKAIGDFTADLPTVKPGTPVIIGGPFGRFSMASGKGRPRLFIAGGIGITPLRSMLGEKVQKDDILLYSARSSADLVFKHEFESARRQGLQPYYFLSEAKATGGRVYSGYINKELIGKLVPDVGNRDVWLCGPPPMMDSVEKELLALGVQKKHLRTERFRL